MSFELLKKGFQDLNKGIKKTELTQEEKELLLAKDVDDLNAQAKMKLQFIKNKFELEKQLAQEQKDSLSD